MSVQNLSAAVGPRVLERLDAHLPELRRVALDPLAVDRQVVVARAWQALCDEGAVGVLVPEEHGGLGQGLLEAVVLAASLSRAGAALPFLPGAVLAVRLLQAAGATAELVEVACGDRVATVAPGAGVQRDRAGRLSGILPAVVHGSDADLWLVVVRERDGAQSVVAVDRPAHDVLVRPGTTRPAVRAELRAVSCRPLAAPHPEALADAARAGELVRQAEVLGAAESLLDPEDRVARLLLRAAWAGVEQAAAVYDVDGTVPASLLADAVTWTARVSAAVGSRPGAVGVARWWAERAGGADAWFPLA